jgi:hypothetical protein
MRHRTPHHLGFSLIEVLLYISLFTVISGFTLETLFQTIKSFTNLRISRDINDSATKIMERMTRDIKSATGVQMAYSTFNDSQHAKLTLDTVSASGTPLTVQYIMIGNALHLEEGPSVGALVDRGSLLSSQTSVAGVLFSYVSVGATVAVKIDLHVTASRGSISDTDHFYDTIVLRGTY